MKTFIEAFLVLLVVSFPILSIAIAFGFPERRSDVRAGVWCNVFGCYREGIMIEPIDFTGQEIAREVAARKMRLKSYQTD